MKRGCTASFFLFLYCKKNLFMDSKKVGRYLVLGVLFFLPVLFLLLLYPATHNYTPLAIVHEKVLDLEAVPTKSNKSIAFKDHITVLGFLGADPIKNSVVASNLKELVYDKFKGFKRFQLVFLVPFGTEALVDKLKSEISFHEDLKFWHFVFAEPNTVKSVFDGLKNNTPISVDLSSNQVFIIDKDLNQRGRLDDRTDREKEKNKSIYGLLSYNSIEVSEIKNKMSDDLRVLFTEYRQRRKGEFNSDTRRAGDLKNQNYE